MTTLTSTGNFTIGDGAVETVDVTLTVIPSAATFDGTGRLIHPTLGTYDYARGPDRWLNMDSDAIIAPVWSSEKTLLGASNTLFLGDLRDVICEERWIQSVAMEVEMARMLIAIWQNPVDPADGYLEWWPNYVTDVGFRVVLLNLSIGDDSGITLSPLIKNGIGWVRGPVRMKMRIVERIE